MGSKKPLDPNWKKKLVLAMMDLGLIPDQYGGKIEIDMNTGGITKTVIPMTYK